MFRHCPAPNWQQTVVVFSVYTRLHTSYGLNGTKICGHTNRPHHATTVRASRLPSASCDWSIDWLIDCMKRTVDLPYQTPVTSFSNLFLACPAIVWKILTFFENAVDQAASGWPQRIASRFVYYFQRAVSYGVSRKFTVAWFFLSFLPAFSSRTHPLHLWSWPISGLLKSMMWFGIRSKVRLCVIRLNKNTCNGNMVFGHGLVRNFVLF